MAQGPKRGSQDPKRKYHINKHQRELARRHQIQVMNAESSYLNIFDRAVVTGISSGSVPGCGKRVRSDG